MYKNYLKRKFHALSKKASEAIATISGLSPLTLYNSFEKELISFKIYGNTASVDNIFDKNNFITLNAIYNGGYLLSNQFVRTTLVPIEVGRTYTVNVNPNGGRLTVSFSSSIPLINSDERILTGIVSDANKTSVTVTAPPNTKYMLIEYYRSLSATEGFSEEDAINELVVTSDNAEKNVGIFICDPTDINFGKYKIPIKVTCGKHENITFIYLDEPLKSTALNTDFIDYENQSITKYINGIQVTEHIEFPPIQLYYGTNIMSVETDIAPSNIEIAYCKSI